MRDIPEEMAARIESGAAGLCHAWVMRRSDGVVMGFTDHDRDLALGEVVATPVEPAPVGSLPWCLTTTGHSALAVDLREARANPILNSWLQERPTEHALDWHLTDSNHFSEPWRTPKTYDGVLFVRDSTPTHPTPNARRAIANRERF